ncbi:hypothetical protein QWY86_00270 [Pedobacter aquatilis]|uniref:hypothetical protein n=1 Tax=Pedobacter aquatilis TaxID=351343 RepID=UPI0025B5497D|nr:hypothetical protein [Pedobacter aquatilis]MDN3585083.1 hypothetical protein [Pedobacter aquatilis]
MDKELIEHIKDSLSVHEEAYTPGAWERFALQEEKKRRGFVLWPLWSAAAIILIIGGFFVFNNNSNIKQQISAKKPAPKLESKKDTIHNSSVNPNNQEVLAKTPQNIIKTKETTTDNIENSVKSAPIEPDYAKVGNQQINPALENNTISQIDLPAVVRQNENTLLRPNDGFNIASINDSKKAELVIEKKKPAQTKLTFEDILARDSYTSNQSKPEKTKGNSKWEPGVFVAPSMGNDNKVNMNYGFSLSYNVANKLSISSGIAYAALSSTSNPSVNNGNLSYDAAASPVMSGKGSSTVSTSKNLESVNANVRGINIPIELKYSISKKLYTGIGVSALAILNNRQDNNYLVSSAQNRTVANAANGYSEQQMLLVTERVSEPQAESATAADKYIGFYNFSLGYKQKISGKKNFAVEPFLRVPMKTFSKDNLNLTNGGLRLKLDF